jgi:hypothetical protein
MTKNEAVDLVQSTFTTAWVATTPIAYDNDNFESNVQTGSWVRLNIQHFSGDLASIGAPGERRFRNVMNVWIIVNTIAGKGGAKPNDLLCEQAELIFKGQHFVLGQESMWFRNVHTRTVGGVGKWYKQNVFATAIFDTIG